MVMTMTIYKFKIFTMGLTVLHVNALMDDDESSGKQLSTRVLFGKIEVVEDHSMKYESSS